MQIIQLNPQKEKKKQRKINISLLYSFMQLNKVPSRIGKW